MLALVLAALAGATPPGEARLAEAAHALSAGRLDQARIMIADAVKSGASGEAIDRLVADLALAAKDDEQALARYKSLLQSQPDDPNLLEGAGLAALRLGLTEEAESLLGRASVRDPSSWRVWNGLGVAADRRGDWARSDEAYARAAGLAPSQAEVANNRGWSLMLRGDWAAAAAELARAAALDPKSRRIADNLELARSAVSAGLPDRASGEPDESWAARLNDAGIIARLQGDRRRAVAAFARAIEARSRWFDRAFNNLAAVEGR